MKRVLLILMISINISNAFTMDWGSAQWIWQQQDGPANTWMSFRKTVNLDELPNQVEAHIAVDSKFWLWINGELVLFEGGLSRGPSPVGTWDRKNGVTPSNSWYQSVNIQPYLKKGENTIAVLAWYWGRETHKGTHIDSKKGGFLFYAEMGNQQVVSDKTWKAIQHTAYDNTIEPASKSLTQYPVMYNAQKGMSDWTDQAWYTEDYNDTNWTAAVEKGNAGVAPWYELVENFVPLLINYGLVDYENQAQLQLPFVSRGETITCRLPFNKQITPYLEIEAKAGDTIFITTDNRLNKINATYITKEGVQAFEGFSWMNGHEVKYTIPAGIKVNALKYRWMSVGEMAGNFELDDPFFSRLWWMGNNTLFVCARDNFMDCPDRERALWIGDVADQTGYLFYSMDDAGRQLLKKAILQTVYFSENDVLGALGPLRVRELVGQSLQFIVQVVWPYYFNTGDIETLEIAYPYVYNYLALFPMDTNGLPEYRKGKSPDSWDWLDWGVKETLDAAPMQPAYYYQALVEAKKMAKILGKKEHLEFYTSRINSIKANYDKVFWKDGFYSSNEKFKDDRANALAITSGLAKPENYEAIVTNVLVPNKYGSPHFEWVAEEALFMAGRPDLSLARMKEMYESQVNSNLTTLYEMFPKGGSYNHAWNGSNTILSKYVAGVRPTKVAWSEYEIMPTLLHFKHLKKTIPTVKGNIDLSIESSDDTYHLQLYSPDEATAVVGIPKNNKEIVTVKVNNRLVWENGKKKDSLNGLVLGGEDASYLTLKLGAGEWDVTATYM
ncbi:alpha-L-rhamnosidase C-terminal domain-containing protein [Mangrovibacterium sp.]|uniref:alpha-L-rhamnosidase-related protein n=1 Tax=Mangrovibacterium sp. TaxID=1961364 RepID=UPI00356A2213